MAAVTTRIILASSSPRRQELLAKLGLEFDIAVPQVNEDIIKGETPVHHVLRLSSKKARLIASRNSDDLVIGADTIVVLGETILGKPSSPDEAVKMLELLSGKSHTVYTGISIIVYNDGIFRSDYDSTRVVFNELDRKAILDYVDSGEPLDKAGAYGIQGMGSFLVHHYEGEFDTVIGFPSKLFNKMYQEVISCRNL